MAIFAIKLIPSIHFIHIVLRMMTPSRNISSNHKAPIKSRGKGSQTKNSIGIHQPANAAPKTISTNPTN